MAKRARKSKKPRKSQATGKRHVATGERPGPKSNPLNLELVTQLRERWSPIEYWDEQFSLQEWLESNGASAWLVRAVEKLQQETAPFSTLQARACVFDFLDEVEYTLKEVSKLKVAELFIKFEVPGFEPPYSRSGLAFDEEKRERFETRYRSLRWHVARSQFPIVKRYIKKLKQIDSRDSRLLLPYFEDLRKTISTSAFKKFKGYIDRSDLADLENKVGFETSEDEFILNYLQKLISNALKTGEIPLSRPKAAPKRKKSKLRSEQNRIAYVLPRRLRDRALLDYLAVETLNKISRSKPGNKSTYDLYRPEGRKKALIKQTFINILKDASIDGRDSKTGKARYRPDIVEELRSSEELTALIDATESDEDVA